MSQKPNSDAEDILSELDSNPETSEKISNSDSLSEPIIPDTAIQNQENSSEKNPVFKSKKQTMNPVFKSKKQTMNPVFKSKKQTMNPVFKSKKQTMNLKHEV